jgi:hypothetical protein
LHYKGTRTKTHALLTGDGGGDCILRLVDCGDETSSIISFLGLRRPPRFAGDVDGVECDDFGGVAGFSIFPCFSFCAMSSIA